MKSTVFDSMNSLPSPSETSCVKGLIVAGLLHSQDGVHIETNARVHFETHMKLCLFDSRCTARCTARQSLHLLWDKRLVLTCAYAAFRTIPRGAVKPAKRAPRREGKDK